MNIDVLVVGAGLSGSVVANVLSEKYKKNVVVIDQRNHLGGNCYDKLDNGILVHQYGPHIFHTSNRTVWDYVHQFADFNQYQLTVKSDIGMGKPFQFPINLLTLEQLYGISDPSEAAEYLKEIRVNYDHQPANFEEAVLSRIGHQLYNLFYRGFTAKSWRVDPMKLPSKIANRLQYRTDYDNRYFSDTFQGMPIGGYTRMIKKMLSNCTVLLKTSYKKFMKESHQIGKVVYTGKIDEYFNYVYGPLGYVSRSFESYYFHNKDYQGCTVINNAIRQDSLIRTTEYKHFYQENLVKGTVIVKEYFSNKGEPMYPVETEYNMLAYDQYRELAKSKSDIHFLGRLGNYRYIDMDDCIADALILADQLG